MTKIHGRDPAPVATRMAGGTTCAFCEIPVFLDLPEHPCCTQAQARGDETCFGCERFKRHEQGRRQ